ncbi:hypothetical protein CARUB_v10011901mg [Capsella rubella]|uniref:Uncharacterized protein n=1 Tax=Capsella rubella TaxID=81985 RepID=R0GP76_9BRAS|nr:uncharacterized protein LOC17897618 isoform X2 [Capsella rubella]EOA37571.1 hypothetical protein CARUB_v10011901mg [Capsella rubella]
MASTASSSLLFPSRNFKSVPLIPLRRRSFVSFIRFSKNPSAEEDILRFVAESDGMALPCVRTYENNSARLSLVGTVAFDQALTAAAADGGEAADDHLRENVPVMVVETVFPGGSDPKATVSTRLFLPTKKVKERAKKLRRSLSEDLSSGDLSKNILAMTFRQVVLRQLWNFQLVLFGPGAEREMGDFENPREVSTSFTLSSTDERVISVIAEVLCISALQSTEKHFLDDYLGKAKFPFFKWFSKHKRIASRDSSVVLHKVFDDEQNTNHLLEYYQSREEKFKLADTRQRSRWWNMSANSKLEKFGGPGFSTWASEYLPAYRLEIDTTILADLKLEGWRKSSENKWEVLLTHSQMVGLAEALDIYFEDIYSLPKKQLPCDVSGNYANLPNEKRGLSLLKIISVTMASGILLLAVSAAAQFCFPQKSERKYPGRSQDILWSENELLSHQSSDSSKLDSFCGLLVNKLKDAYCWVGEITLESSIGAWIGEVPDYLKETSRAKSVDDPIVSSSSLLEKLNEDAKASAQDIATYQVVLSPEGKIIGFQPTSRVAVNHWAANPLARELYEGKKLSPGLIEPGLKSRPPTKVVVLELLMSVNSDRPFALVRPLLPQ